MRIIAIKPHGNKFMVTQASDFGRTFRNIMTKEQLDELRKQPVYELTPEERAARAIPFGQPGYRG